MGLFYLILYEVKENIPGASSGSVRESVRSGESYGQSTLSRKTIRTLNKANSSSHEKVEVKQGEDGICMNYIADD